MAPGHQYLAVFIISCPISLLTITKFWHFFRHQMLNNPTSTCNTTCTVNKMRYGLQNMIIKNKQQILGKVITYYCTAINNPICKTRLIGMQCVRIINVMKKINTQLAKLPETNNTVGQIPKVNTKILCIYLLSFCLTEASCLQGFKVNTICTCQSIHTLQMYHCRVKQI